MCNELMKMTPDVLRNHTLFLAGMCDMDLRPQLYNNAIVTGGNSLLQVSCYIRRDQV